MMAYIMPNWGGLQYLMVSKQENHSRRPKSTSNKKIVDICFILPPETLSNLPSSWKCGPCAQPTSVVCTEKIPRLSLHLTHLK